MKFYLNFRKITKKAATELLGKETIAKYIKEAKMEYKLDPRVELTWYIGNNQFIEIKFN